MDTAPPPPPPPPLAPLETLADWRRAGEEVVCRSRRIFRVALGPAEAPPVLFLHGFPTASADFAPVAARLRDRLRLVLFDFLGYGFSEKPAGHRYSLLEQADIAEAVARGAGLERWHVVAHDMGASVALELLRRPDAAARTASLTLLNAGLLLAFYRPLLVQRLLRLPVAGDLVARAIGRRAFGRALAATFGAAHPPGERLLDEMWELVARERGLRAYPRLIRYIDERAVHEPAWLEAFRAYRGPVQLVWGPEDPVSGAVAAPFAALRPGTEVVALAGVGHYPQIEDPGAVADAIAALVARAPPP
jgi:pimeloyl-ACP methyl ester carboxylesterase